MWRSLLLAALTLAACDTSSPADDNESNAPVAKDTHGLCLPVRPEAEILGDAKRLGLGEDTWRQTQATACVHAQARVLARGTDAAPTIADAAVEYCRPQANLWIRATMLRYEISEADLAEQEKGTFALLRASATMEVLMARAGNCFGELVQQTEYSHDANTQP